MTDLLTRLPPHFAHVPYEGGRIPDGVNDLSQGANCQLYAYAVLAHFGILLPPLRSSELWADDVQTIVVQGAFQPLDLLLFGRSGDPYGAHVGVYSGDGMVLHLARSVGRPALWPLQRFADRPEYRVLIGGKRAIRSE